MYPSDVAAFIRTVLFSSRSRMETLSLTLSNWYFSSVIWLQINPIRMTELPLVSDQLLFKNGRHDSINVTAESGSSLICW